MKSVRLSKFNNCIFSASLWFGVLPSAAYSVHFKIDLPLEKGKEPSENYADQIFMDSQKQNSSFDADLKEENISLDEDAAKSLSQKNMTPNVDIPEDIGQQSNMQSPIRQRKSAEQKNQKTQLFQTKNESISVPNSVTLQPFPTPKCLESNVLFWQNVYSRWDFRDAVLHDRNNLGTILGVYSSEPSQHKSRQLNEIKNEIVKQLNDIADKLETEQSLNKTELMLVRKLKQPDVSPKNVRAVADGLRFQTGLKSQFKEGVTRSLRYLPTVQNIIRSENLPSDIAFLPHVESSYNPTAKSKVGASGLWQIMPYTMKEIMGSRYIGQRSDVDISTRAATKLLSQNMAVLKNWPLALTAYNHGVNGMVRAVKTVGTTDFCEILNKYESKSFKFASSNFYAQFLAARNESVKMYTTIAKDKKFSRVLDPILAQNPKKVE